MGVRRPQLGVQVVTVVPDHRKTEVVHRREGRRPGADDDPHRTAGHREEPAVALGRSEVSGQRDVGTGTEGCGESGIDPRHVAGVGNDHDDQDQRHITCHRRQRCLQL